jgi:hypothetical protein
VGRVAAALTAVLAALGVGVEHAHVGDDATRVGVRMIGDAVHEGPWHNLDDIHLPGGGGARHSAARATAIRSKISLLAEALPGAPEKAKKSAQKVACDGLFTIHKNHGDLPTKRQWLKIATDAVGASGVEDRAGHQAWRAVDGVETEVASAVSKSPRDDEQDAESIANELGCGWA